MSAPYLGDYAANSTVHFLWATNGADGASITRSTNGTVQVYKNNDNTGEVTTGVTDTEDFDGLTGIHACTIATTDAFYATGKNYTVVLNGAVIDGKSVNSVLAHFSIGNRTVTGSAPSAATVAAAVWDEALSGHSTAGTAGKKLTDIPTTTYTVPTAADNADAVWDEALSGHVAAGSAGKKLGDLANTDNAAVADAVWDEQLSGHTTAGSAGKQLQDVATGTPPSAAAVADAVWDELLSGHTTAGSAGKQLADVATGTPPSAAAVADAVWDEALSGHLSAGSTGEALNNADDAATIIIASAPVSVTADSGTVNTGVSVSNSYLNTFTDDDIRWVTRPAASLDQTMTFPAGTGTIPTSVSIQGFWNGSGRHADVYALNDRTALYDKLSSSATFMASRTTDRAYSYSLSRDHIDDSGVVTIKFASTSANTADRLQLDQVLVYYVPVAAGSTGNALTPQQVWEYFPRTLTSDDDPEPISAVDIADAVWDEPLSGHAVSGSTGEALSNAGTAASVPTAAQVADAVWDELMSGHTTPDTFGMLLDAIFTSDLSDFDANAADRSMLNALRFIRNKWTTSGGTLTVLKEDDVTTAWTADIIRSTGASPITTVDPA